MARIAALEIKGVNNEGEGLLMGGMDPVAEWPGTGRLSLPGTAGCVRRHV
jgi:hypothetical protein